MTDRIAAALDTPVYVVRITGCDGTVAGELVAHSTADALASFLRRLPAKGAAMFAPTADRLERRHDEAARRFVQHGSTPAGIAQLVCPRYVGDPASRPLYTATKVATL